MVRVTDDSRQAAGSMPMVVHRPPRRTGSSRGDVALVVLAGMAGLAAVARYLVQFGGRATNEDQAMLWYAGRDLGFGRLHQPTLYGRPYGSILEALPGEVLRWAGLGPEHAFPTATALLFTAPWWFAATMAWRRGHRWPAVLAAGLPVLFVLDGLAVEATPLGWGASLFLGGLVMGLAVGWRDDWRALTVATLLGSMGVAFNPGTALVVAPALIIMAWGQLRDRRLWIALPLAALPSAAYWLALQRFLAANPDYNFHAKYRLTPDPLILRRLPGRLDDYLGAFRFVLAPWWWMTAVVVLVVVAAAILRARWVGAAAGLSGLGIVILALGSPKSLDYLDTIYLSPSRFVLFLPHFLWLMVWLAADGPAGDGTVARWPRAPRWATGVAAAAVAVSLVVWMATFDTRRAELHDSAVAAGAVTPRSPAEVAAKCATIDAARRRTGAEAVYFRSDRVAAYTCSARAYGQEPMLVPSYDVRTWTMHDEQRRSVTRILASDTDPGWCDRVRQAAPAITCTPVGPELALIEVDEPMAALELWRLAGEPVRELSQ